MSRRGSIDAFVVWILNNVPQFEQAAFRTLGLHAAVLRLFDSPSDEARCSCGRLCPDPRAGPIGARPEFAWPIMTTRPVRALAGDLLQARPARRGGVGGLGAAPRDQLR